MFSMPPRDEPRSFEGPSHVQTLQGKERDDGGEVFDTSLSDFSPVHVDEEG